MEKLYIVMPAYNEEGNIENVVRDWYKVLSLASIESKLIVADSGSSDDTHNILTRLQKELPNLVVLSDTLKQHGPKLIALYKYSITNGADYIFQTDSDGQTNPEEFRAFWDLRNDYDVIIGHRVIRGDGIIRKFIENIVCLLLRIYFGVKVKDANAPFRLMKKEVLSRYICRFEDDYNIPNIMLTTFFSYYNDKLCYKRITFKPRQAGNNSIKLSTIISIGIKALSDFRNFKREMH